jgi:hypothetical protein
LLLDSHRFDLIDAKPQFLLCGCKVTGFDQLAFGMMMSPMMKLIAASVVEPLPFKQIPKGVT